MRYQHTAAVLLLIALMSSNFSVQALNIREYTDEEWQQRLIELANPQIPDEFSLPAIREELENLKITDQYLKGTSDLTARKQAHTQMQVESAQKNTKFRAALSKQYDSLDTSKQSLYDRMNRVMRQQLELRNYFPEAFPDHVPIVITTIQPAATPAVTAATTTIAQNTSSDSLIKKNITTDNSTPSTPPPPPGFKLRTAFPYQPGQRIVVYATANPDSPEASSGDILALYTYRTDGWHQDETIRIPLHEEGCEPGKIHSIAASTTVIRLGCHNAHSYYYSLQNHKPDNIQVERHDLKNRPSRLHITAVAFDGTHFYLGYQGRYYMIPDGQTGLEGTPHTFDYPKNNYLFQTETLSLIVAEQSMFMTMSPAKQPFHGSTTMFHKATINRDRSNQSERQDYVKFLSEAGNIISKITGYGFSDQIYLSPAFDPASNTLCFMGASHEKEVVQLTRGKRHGVCVHKPLAEKPRTRNRGGFSAFDFDQFKAVPSAFHPRFVTSNGNGLMLVGGREGSTYAIYAVDMMSTARGEYISGERGYEVLSLADLGHYTPLLATFIPAPVAPSAL